MTTVSEKEDGAHHEEQTVLPFLRRVRIRGYKSIGFCDVELAPLTVLVGRNASGKSNFLDALAFLRDLVALGVSEAVKRHGGNEAIPCRLREDRVASIEIECGSPTSGEGERWAATYRIDIEFPKKRSPKVRREGFRIEVANWWVGYTNDNGQVTCQASDDEPQQRTWKTKDRLFLDAYVNDPVSDFAGWVTSMTTYNFHPGAIRRVQKPNPGWFLERDGGNLASVIDTIGENDKSTLERLGRYLFAITESVELVGVARYGEYETVRFRIARGGEDGPLEFDAAGMSDGTLRALAALVAAFQLVSPDEQPSLVAIEEPETSLHPAAMRALVDALDEATLRTQVLLTTHSADLLDNPTIRPENVRVVELVGGQTVIGPVDEASVEIVRRRLDTLGGLERQNQLALDDQDRQRLSQNGQGPKE